MRLNVEKIRDELLRIDKNQSWLAEKMGISRALLSYKLHSGNITHAQGFAHALGFCGRDLILED